MGKGSSASPAHHTEDSVDEAVGLAPGNVLTTVEGRTQRAACTVQKAVSRAKEAVPFPERRPSNVARLSNRVASTLVTSAASTGGGHDLTPPVDGLS